MIERDLDIPFVADLALREKQIQQNYRPVIAVHKWFARRPGTLFRGLLLAEFGDRPVAEAFFRSNDLGGLCIADPFMGGGTPLLEANRLGCDVLGWDINPMAYWVVRQEIEHLDLAAYREAAVRLSRRLAQDVGHLYRTGCVECGSREASVKYFLWVKWVGCRACGREIDLFPGYLLAADQRHPRNVLVCGRCGALTEAVDRHRPGRCAACSAPLTLEGPARRGRCLCPHCGEENLYPGAKPAPPRHRMFAIEYHCPSCRAAHKGRFFKAPDQEDLASYAAASAQCRTLVAEFVPDDEIPCGDETDRLHRWGYRLYREMFNERQILGLELSARHIAAESDVRVRNALATNLSDLLRYQNMLCRYDTVALKSLDIFSVHGFPVGLVQCESNLLGIPKDGGSNVGSGGWSNIVDKYFKAKAYCERPFEVRYRGGRKLQIPISGEWIGDVRAGADGPERRGVDLRCGSATVAELPAGSLDAVFTDPPYFGNVQYAELMDFCYVWLRRLLGASEPAFRSPSTRHQDELTENITRERGLEHFTEGLSAVFARMVHALKPGAPLVFTYHHNKLEAYSPIAVAILDAGLTCSASLPCPAEMGASIHINGTGSSVVDTVFVCRTTGSVPRRWIADEPERVAELVRADLAALREGGVRPTRGDLRCILYGHLVRLCIWRLRNGWDSSRPIAERLAAIDAQVQLVGPASAVEGRLEEDLPGTHGVRARAIREDAVAYRQSDEIRF